MSTPLLRRLNLLLLLPAFASASGFGDIPIRFEPNVGQTDPRAQFLARGAGYVVYLSPGEAVLKLRTPKTRDSRLIRLRWVGGAGGSAAQGLDEMASKSHYFVGNDPKKWRSNVPNYGRVRYREVYPGIDIVFRGTEGRLEYDLEVAPGVDPGRIRLAVSGVDRTRLDKSGDLLFEIGGAVVRQPKPVVYEDSDDGRRRLDGRYVLLAKNLFGFEVPERDPRMPLTIDPVLVYSTFVGGSSGDWAEGIALDSSGRVYVTGGTGSGDLPTTGGAYVRHSGGEDVMVARLNREGTALEYATYLGGSLHERGTRIAVDSSGNAYVAGYTTSTDFPKTANALRLVYGGGQYDGFVSMLDPSGSTLVYSSFIGGNRDDFVWDITLDSLRNVYLTGATSSTNFPTTTGALRTSLAGGYDGFVTKIDPATGGAVYSTYFGGTADDYGNAIKVDAQGQAYVGGLTYSDNFPTTAGVFQPKRSGHDDSFLSKLNSSGNGLVFSTYLGGNCEEETSAIALDRYGNAYLTGYVETRYFPVTAGAYQPWHAGGDMDAFVAKVDVTGAYLHYATYLGGGLNDWGKDIAVDPVGNAYVVGWTESGNFPVTPAALQPTFRGEADGFLVKLSPRGTHLGYSTYLGGSYYDSIQGIARDSGGDVYIAGLTESSNFPTTAGSHRPNLAGAWDAFAARLRLPAITTVSAASFLAGAPVAANAIVAGYGPEMSPGTQVAPDGQPLPTVLGGVTVSVRDSAQQERLAPLFFVSSGQINYLVPSGTAGGVATVTVKNGAQVVSYGLLDIEPTGPGLFTANFDGQGAPAAFVIRVKADGTPIRQNAFQCGPVQGSCVPAPIDMGPDTDRIFLELYGTGIRGVSSLAAAGATVGGVDATVHYAGAVPAAFAGLDQANVEVPRSLRGRGLVDLVLTVDRKQANPVRLNFQ